MGIARHCKYGNRIFEDCHLATSTLFHTARHSIPSSSHMECWGRTSRLWRHLLGLSCGVNSLGLSSITYKIMLGKRTRKSLPTLRFFRHLTLWFYVLDKWSGRGKWLQDVLTDIYFYFTSPHKQFLLPISQHALLFFFGSHLESASFCCSFLMLGTILYEPEGPGSQGKKHGGYEGTRSRGPSMHGMQRSLVNILWQPMPHFLSREKIL